MGAATLFTTRFAMGKEYPFSEATLGGKLAAGTAYLSTFSHADGKPCST